MGLKLAVFGTFYPEYNFAGNSTTPIVVGLARLDSVDSVVVYCQTGARLPPGVSGSKIQLLPSWKHDHTAGILLATLRMVRRSNRVDGTLFNTYVTAYGRRGLTNAVGLLLPTLVARLGRSPTFVYMHNFVETQDVEKLGYRPSRALLWAVSMLEKLMLRTSQVIVPLPSHAEIVELRLAHRPAVLFLPFLEGYVPSKYRSQGETGGATAGPTARRVVLLGTWGPQKDLRGAMTALDQVADRVPGLEITLAGADNKHFPGHLAGLSLGSYPRLQGRLTILGALPDRELFELLTRNDLLVLPYLTSGGYSGALNFAASSGIRIVAYDLPQLREHATLLDADVIFVRPEGLAEMLLSILTQPMARPSSRSPSVASANRRTEDGLATLASMIGEPGGAAP
jgi:glycosyltransferase involved in cell wall biosynthesis